MIKDAMSARDSPPGKKRSKTPGSAVSSKSGVSRSRSKSPTKDGTPKPPSSKASSADGQRGAGDGRKQASADGRKKTPMGVSEVEKFNEAGLRVVDMSGQGLTSVTASLFSRKTLIHYSNLKQNSHFFVM